MHDADPPPDFGLYDPPPRHGRGLLLGLFWLSGLLFFGGGLYFGWVFLDNWRSLATQRPGTPVQVQVPGGVVFTIPSASDVLHNIPIPAAPAVPGLPSRDRDPVAPPILALPDWTGRERINVLLLGIDHRDGEPIEGSRSDTVMVVSIDPASKSVVMVSLPRDLWVAIPGYGEQRINVAHSLGGPQLVMSTVAANFGVRSTHYARIDFHGFEQIVDTLGGILVDVERPIKDDEYPTEDFGVMRIYIPPGPQWMDGKTALQYARSRHSENDFGRARRQQRVLMAIRERGMQGRTLLKIPELLPLAQKTVATSFSPADLLALAKLSSQIDHERIVNLVIDADYASPFVTGDGASVLLPNRAAIQASINQAFQRSAAIPTATPAAQLPTPTPIPTPLPSLTNIEVLNGTSRNGLAAAAASVLRGRGYTVTNVASADRADYPDTRLLTQPGREPAARALADSLGLPATAVQPLPANPSGPDIRLILGTNFQLPVR